MKFENTNREMAVEEDARQAAKVLYISEEMRREQAANGRRPWDGDTWNDAEMRGQQSLEFDALMEREAQIIVRHPSRNRDCVKEKRGWRAKTKTWRAHLDDSLTFHIESDRKEGPGYVFGRSANGERAAENMREVYAVGLDIEPEMPFAEVAKACDASGLAIVLYTSFNFGAESANAPVDKVLKYGAISTNSVRAFLTDKGKFSEDFIEQCELISERGDIEGKRQTVWSTPPQQKMRAIVILDQPVDVSLLDDSPRKGLDIYSNKVRGLAQLLGVVIDPAAVDPSRVLYVAKHHPDREWHLQVFRGRGVSWYEIPEVEAENSSGLKTIKPNGIPDIVTSDGTDVTALYKRYGKRWLLTDMLDGSNAEKKSHGGYMDVVCPFEHEHTSESSETSTRIWDAGEYDNVNGFAFARCQHSCGQRYHLIHYVAAWIEDETIDPAWLGDPSYMLAAPETPGKFEQLTPFENLGMQAALDYWRTGGSDLNEIVGRIVEMGGDEDYARQRAEEAMLTVQHQAEWRKSDSERDPVADARIELGAAPPPDLLADLYDRDWITPDGIMVSPSDRPAVYKKHGIDPESENAEAQGRQVIRNQIVLGTTARFDWVVIDGQTKIAMRPVSGQPVKMWKETTPDKIYRNQWVTWFGENGGVKHIKPHEVFASARERPTYIDTCFEPDLSRAPQYAYNIWNGFAADAVPGEWPLMRWHILHVLCDGDETAFNYVMTYIASLFQRPGVKIPAALAFVGEQGTGKSKFFDWLRRAIGSAALKVSSSRHLTGNFNAHLDGKILLVCEEAFWAGDKASAGPLKDIISSETIPIEGKFENVVERRNTVNTVFISNNDWLFPTDGEDARRFLGLRVSNAKKQDAKYFGALDDEMENGGMEAMVYDLMHWDPAVIGGWEGLRSPPRTDVLRQQIAHSIAGPAAILLDIIETGALSGRMPDGTTFHYPLSEDNTTMVADAHLKSVLVPQGGRGNIAQEANKAIDTLLGKDARSDNKHSISFQANSMDNTSQTTNERVRGVVFPSLQNLENVLHRYGRKFA